MHGFLLFLGAGLVLMGMILVLSNLRNVARRKRILATATSPISQAMGGPVEIKGNIVPSEKGLVEAPLSGRQAVWTRVTVEQYRSGSDGNPGGSSIVLSEVNGRPFFVDDNSGEVARIIPDGANVVLDQQSIGSSGQFHDPPPGFEEFLSMRGLSSKGFFGFNKTMSFYEELLTPGDALYARGPSRREQGRPNREGSGTAPLGQLVMYAAAGTGGPSVAKHCCQAAGQGASWTDSCGMSALRSDHNRRPWTMCHSYGSDAPVGPQVVQTIPAPSGAGWACIIRCSAPVSISSFSQIGACLSPGVNRCPNRTPGKL